MFGPTISQFQECAKLCRMNGDPGVILLAHGDKSEPIISAIENDCVNILIIDQMLAKDMEDIEPGLKK